MRSRVLGADGAPRRWWRDQPAAAPHPDPCPFCAHEVRVPVRFEWRGWVEVDGRPMLEADVYLDSPDDGQPLTPAATPTTKGA